VGETELSYFISYFTAWLHSFFIRVVVCALRSYVRHVRSFQP
jgi:hypothetical protein